MSVTEALSRIAEIQTMLQPRAAAPAAAATAAPTTFADMLQTQWGAAGGTAPATGLAPIAGLSPVGMTPLTGGVGARMVQIAQAEVGQAEQPPGSNDSPRIAEYRTATSGSGVGPWCAYFTSWVAKQAGAPVGEAGQGFGAVSSVAEWGQRTGRFQPAGSVPQPGDLIIWGGSHIGLVESVGADGSIHTIEGNSSDAVSRRTYGADGGGATGYVRVG